MKIADIMTTNVESIQLDESLQAAAQKMRDLNIGFLPVLENGELIGAITDRDLVVRTMAGGMRPNKRIEKDLISAPCIYCFEDQEVESVVQLMQMHQIRRLVVLDRGNGSLAGIVSLGDLAINTPSDTSGEVLQVVSGELLKTH